MEWGRQAAFSRENKSNLRKPRVAFRLFVEFSFDFNPFLVELVFVTKMEDASLSNSSPLSLLVGVLKMMVEKKMGWGFLR